MKIQDDNWSLFRLSDRKQFDNISLEIIDFFFRALTEESRIGWLMWREGFTGWRPLGELSQILKHLEIESVELPTPPPVPEAVLKYAEEITGVRNLPENMTDDLTPNTVSNRAIDAATASVRVRTVTRTEPLRTVGEIARKENVLTMENEATLSLMLESQAATEDRNNTRYHMKFKVRIFTQKGVVVLDTIDCSTSGFRLKEPLPPGLPRFFHVEIDLGPDGRIPLVCSEIREKDGRAATRVRIQINDHLNTLKSALLRAA